MNMSTDSLPPNKPPDAVAKNNRRKRVGIGCGVVLLVLAAGMVLAGVRWGPGVLHMVTGPGAAAQRTLSPEAKQLAALRLADEERLNSFGWVDSNQQVVHIPIERAMLLVADAGLPVGVTPTPVAASDGQQPEATSAAASTPAVDLANVSFKDNVLPIFEQHCAKCHGDEKSEEGLKLIRYRTVMGGSQNGPVVEPGNPDNSYLVEMVTSGKMPKEGEPLTQGEIDVIVAWIEAGAKDN